MKYSVKEQVELIPDQPVVSRYSLIWMTDPGSWIITVWEAGESVSGLPTSLSALLHSHIWVTYCSVALRWYSVSVSCVSLLFVSLFLPFLIICVSVTLPPGVISSLLLSLSLCSPYLSVSECFLFVCFCCFFVYTPCPPLQPPGFLSRLSTLRKLKNWYIVISPLSATEQGAEFKVSPIQ